MRSYAATWGQTLRKLRFPAAVPYIVPALRLAAAASVVGVVVAEISTGQRGGIGRLVIEYGRTATADPERCSPPCSAPRCSGSLMALLIAGMDWFVDAR